MYVRFEYIFPLLQGEKSQQEVSNYCHLKACISKQYPLTLKTKYLNKQDRPTRAQDYFYYSKARSFSKSFGHHKGP